MKKSILQSIGFLQYGVMLLVLFAGVIGYQIVKPNSKDVLVTVRLADKDMIWQDNGSPRSVMADLIVAGMKEKDALGRTVAEVTHVRSFDQERTDSVFAMKKTVYVTLKLSASHNGQTGEYRYQGTVLKSGDWIRLTVQSTVINGIIMTVGSQATPPTEWMTVNARIKSDGPFLYDRFSETTGVDPSMADGILVGDTMKDSDGTVLAEILAKRVVPASTITQDQYGNLYDRPHPRRVDVFLTVKLAVRKIGDTYLFLDSAPVKVNAPVPLFLSRIDIEPNITEIVTSAD